MCSFFFSIKSSAASYFWIWFKFACRVFFFCSFCWKCYLAYIDTSVWCVCMVCLEICACRGVCMSPSFLFFLAFSWQCNLAYIECQCIGCQFKCASAYAECQCIECYWVGCLCIECQSIETQYIGCQFKYSLAHVESQYFIVSALLHTLNANMWMPM